MAQTIAVIDYGLGNLRSVSKAVEHVVDAGDRVLVTDDPQAIAAADRVVFPGQGAARDCMAAIRQHHVNKAVQDAVQNKPFLGICMGLQVLLERSEENGGTELLGVIPGHVERFSGEHTDAAGMLLKIPHMGWNQVEQTVEHPMWTSIEQNSRFYFVHSYFVVPDDGTQVAGRTEYGQVFTSVLASENLFAVQFHPEKSASAGLQLLRNFVNWKP